MARGIEVTGRDVSVSTVYGFRKRGSTMECTFSVQSLIEKRREYSLETHITYYL
jgi:hypothetical protein